MLNYYKAEIKITKRLKMFSSQEDIEKDVSVLIFKEENLSDLMGKVLDRLEISFIAELKKDRETDEFTSFTYHNTLPRRIYDRYVNNEIPFEEKSYFIKISRVFELGVSFKTIADLEGSQEEELEEVEV